MSWHVTVAPSNMQYTYKDYNCRTNEVYQTHYEGEQELKAVEVVQVGLVLFTTPTTTEAQQCVLPDLQNRWGA